MALVLADRVKVRSKSTGTGTLTLESTVIGFQSFETIGNGNTTYYGITDVSGNWEIGIGTYTSTGTTLSRDTVISSSNNNLAVDFPEGGKTVFCTFPSTVLESLAGADIGGFDFTGNTISTDDNGDITISQNVLPSIDSDGTTGYTLGSASFKWKELFVSNGSIYIGDIKLSNVGGKLSAKKVINPGEETEEDDPEDDDAVSEIRGGGAAVVERGVVFPEGEEGDVAGVLVNNDGVLYLSTADWTDANDVTKEFNITNASEFAVSQTGGLYNVIDASEADFPELIALFNFTQNQNIYNSADWTIDAGVDFGGPKVCYDVVYNFELNVLTFLWTHEAGDPTSIAVDYPATVTYTGTLPQPGIWKRLIAADYVGTQILTNGGNIELTVEESAADQGDGSILLEYIPHPDSTNSVNSTLTVNDTNINLDVGNNDLWLESDGLSFDSGYALMKPTSATVAGNSTDIVYTTKNIRGFTRVVKLLIKVECNDNFQACEMLVVVGDTVEGVDTRIRHTVYAVVHTSDSPLATFSAQWNNTDGTIQITATNADTVNNMFVETTTIEMTQWD